MMNSVMSLSMQVRSSYIKNWMFSHKTVPTYILVFAFVGHVLFLFVYNKED
jgi:hypothetical protein